MYKVYVGPRRSPTHITLQASRDEWSRVVDELTKSQLIGHRIVIEQEIRKSDNDPIRINLPNTVAEEVLTALGISG